MTWASIAQSWCVEGTAHYYHNRIGDGVKHVSLTECFPDRSGAGLISHWGPLCGPSVPIYTGGLLPALHLSRIPLCPLLGLTQKQSVLGLYLMGIGSMTVYRLCLVHRLVLLIFHRWRPMPWERFLGAVCQNKWRRLKCPARTWNQLRNHLWERCFWSLVCS